MQIRTKLTIQFVCIVALISLISHIAIYYFSAQYRETQFYQRLRNKAITTAELLIKVDAVSADLLKIIDQNQKDQLYKENVTIYNYLNKKIYFSKDTTQFQTTIDQLDKIRTDGEQHWSVNDFEVIGIPYYDRFNRFVVTASAIDRFGVQKLKNLRNILGTSFIFSLVVVACAGWIYAGRSLKPINSIVNKVDTITGSNLEIRLDEGNKTDELARLSATFNKMLTRIEDAFQIQKTFVANASHEIKNPLAVITSQLEIILLRERTASEYKDTIHSVLEDIRNLNNISLRLLDLAKLSNTELTLEMYPLRIDELIWHCKENMTIKSSGYQIIFSPQLPDDEKKLLIKGDEKLLKTAFDNLIDNACKFSDNKQVIITLIIDPKDIIIEFIDSGSGISENDIPYIFEPFFRGNNSLNTNGHGIGLSLTSRIIKLHKGIIDVKSSPGKGSVFTIKIPRV
jgi:signal transduction histidine kinase